MKIIERLSLPDVRQFSRDVIEAFHEWNDRNVNFNGRRIINAGRSQGDFDYVIRAELAELLSPIRDQITVNNQAIGMLNQDTTIRTGPFATRGSAIARRNTLFLASDRDYMAWYSTGAVWVYAFGVRSITQPEITAFTAELTTDDVGAVISATDFKHRLRWNGTALTFDVGDDGSGYIANFAIAPNGGTWAICDGVTYSYLKEDGTTDDFITPDLTTAAYLKLGLTTVLGPTAASGTTANTTATNQAEAAHTHAVDPPSTASGAPSATTEVEAGTGSTVASSAHTHTTDIGSFSSGAGSSHNHTQDAHNHAPGTLELLRTQLTAYFRR